MMASLRARGGDAVGQALPLVGVEIFAHALEDMQPRDGEHGRVVGHAQLLEELLGAGKRA